MYMEYIVFLVLQRIIFSHTPDEAMSGGLAKACVPGKKCSVPEKIEFFIENQTEWEVYIHLSYFFFSQLGCLNLFGMVSADRLSQFMNGPTMCQYHTCVLCFTEKE